MDFHAQIILLQEQMEAIFQQISVLQQDPNLIKLNMLSVKTQNLLNQVQKLQQQLQNKLQAVDSRDGLMLNTLTTEKATTDLLAKQLYSLTATLENATKASSISEKETSYNLLLLKISHFKEKLQ